MKKRELQRIVLLACVLLVILAGAVGLWMRKEQQQNTLNRQLIEAMDKYDADRMLALINMGADPNTPAEQVVNMKTVPNTPAEHPVLTLNQLWNQLIHRAPPDDRIGTVFYYACSESFKRNVYFFKPNTYNTYTTVLVEAMLKHGAKINIQFDSGETVLLYALGNQAVVRVLLEHGADINAKDDRGDTALYYLVSLVICNSKDQESEYKNEIRQLIQYGANPNLSDDNGDTALEYAAREKRSDLVALMTKTPSNSSAPKQTPQLSGKR